MQHFSPLVAEKVREIAPALYLRLLMEQDISHRFYTYQIDEKSDVYICYGIASLDEKEDEGEWIVIEPSLSRLRAFLKKFSNDPLLSRKKLSLFSETETAIDYLGRRCIHRKYSFIRGKKEGYSRFVAACEYYIQGSAFVFSAYADFGVSSITNTLMACSQVLTLPEPYEGSRKRTPAIVVGAGPSLDRDKELLQKLAATHTIIGCGSAIQLLKERGIACDFAAILDPHPPAERYAALNEITPLVMLSGACHKMASHFTGPKIVVGSSLLHPLEDLLLQKRGIVHRMQGGWNAATLGLEWARFLGCDRIYSTGIDLTESGYAAGIDSTIQRSSIERREARLCMKKVLPLSRAQKEGEKKAFSVHEKLSFPKEDLCKLVIGAIAEACENLYAIEKMGALAEFELEHSLLYETYLLPLWKIWKDSFESEEKEARYAFFLSALSSLEAYLKNNK